MTKCLSKQVNPDAFKLKSYFTEYGGAPSGWKENHKVDFFTLPVSNWVYAHIRSQWDSNTSNITLDDNGHSRWILLEYQSRSFPIIHS